MAHDSLRIELESSSTDFTSCIREKMFCDIDILCKNGVKIGAHKVILSMKSPALAEIIKNSEGSKVILIYEDHKIVEKFLNCLYGGLVFVNKDELKTIENVAKSFDLKLTTHNDVSVSNFLVSDDEESANVSFDNTPTFLQFTQKVCSPRILKTGSPKINISGPRNNVLLSPERDNESLDVNFSMLEPDVDIEEQNTISEKNSRNKRKQSLSPNVNITYNRNRSTEKFVSHNNSVASKRKRLISNNSEIRESSPDRLVENVTPRPLVATSNNDVHGSNRLNRLKQLEQLRLNPFTINRVPVASKTPENPKVLIKSSEVIKKSSKKNVQNTPKSTVAATSKNSTKETKKQNNLNSYFPSSGNGSLKEQKASLVLTKRQIILKELLMVKTIKELRNRYCLICNDLITEKIKEHRKHCHYRYQPKSFTVCKFCSKNYKDIKLKRTHETVCQKNPVQI